jgi:hypothetical protein|tara:strand:+ start:201 stop:404 length:204 start_codon:yes stop_codon:yes gene_type:complete
MDLRKTLKNRAGIFKEEITSQQFVDMVNDEFDLETLELMKQTIENQITLITTGQGIATRNPIKGFGE